MSPKRPSISVSRSGKGRDQRCTAGDGVGIAVDGEDLAAGGFENGARIAARAEGSIDINAAIARRQCSKHLRQHDRRDAGRLFRR